jgi:hypothetical protein
MTGTWKNHLMIKNYAAMERMRQNFKTASKVLVNWNNWKDRQIRAEHYD